MEVISQNVSATIATTPTALDAFQSFLQRLLRITSPDNRVFPGTFEGYIGQKGQLQGHKVKSKISSWSRISIERRVAAIRLGDKSCCWRYQETWYVP